MIVIKNLIVGFDKFVRKEAKIILFPFTLTTLKENLTLNLSHLAFRLAIRETMNPSRKGLL